MKSLIQFFIDNPKFNYFLFFMTFFIGIYSYIMMPKELFPTIALDAIKIEGSYAGSSANTLNKMIVKDLEDDLVSYEEFKDIDTVITSGHFVIIGKLKDGFDRTKAKDDADKIIKKYLINLPSDMNEPVASVIDFVRPAIYLAIDSNKKTKKQLLDIADDLKTSLYSINGVGEINIFGDSDDIIEFVLDEKKIEGYNLSKEQVISTLSNLSYTFPIGTIKDNKNGYYYISMNDGNKNLQEFKNTILKFGNKTIYFSDIAKINYTLKEASTIALKDNKKAIIMSINQSDGANALKLVSNIKKYVSNENKKIKNYHLSLYNDSTVSIKHRLNTVISNILFGMVLVIFALYFLVNKRLSFIISLGIPTSFVIAFAVSYQLGYSINIISLLGFLIALGIIVDDAVVIGENIQRYIEEGMDKKEAALKGTLEMFKPVTLASLTTLFAFLPMLMLSGTLGKFIQYIPIMVSFLVVASLIEVFIFLPIHSIHTLNKKDKARSWKFFNDIYRKLLTYTIHFKKTFLVLYFVLIPLATVYILKTTTFQLFPEFDSSKIVISGNFDRNNNLAKTEEEIKELDTYLEKNKHKYFIKSFTTVLGVKTNADKSTQTGDNMFKIEVELEENLPENFMDKYINPIFSFEKIETGKRNISSKEISKKILQDIKKLDSYKLFKEINIYETKAGPIKTDIKIGLISNHNDIVIANINKLIKKLNSIKGVKDISSDLEYGIPEYKLKINRYGESLGLTEKQLGFELSSLYLENKKFNIYTKQDLIEVDFVTSNKNNLNDFKNTIIDINNKKVYLKDVVDFNTRNSFLKIMKEKGKIIKNVYANVNTDIITSTEVLNKLKPLLDNIKAAGITLSMGGEKEKNKDLGKDMRNASLLSLMLIILALLYMFNKFSYVFIVVSVIPYSILGALIGHLIMGMNLSMPSMIGILGLAGVVINDSIIMLSFVEKSKNSKDFFERAILRFRPIVLTSITTMIGLVSLIFFASGQAVILQPIAVSLGFGLLWGTVINLFYVPALFATLNKYTDKEFINRNQVEKTTDIPNYNIEIKDI